MSEKKYSYRVRPGCKWGPYHEYGPGSVIELTVEEAEGFRDLLELVKRSASPAPLATTPPPEDGEETPAPETKPDEADHLMTMTAAQLKHLPEWSEVEPPRPTTKAGIVQAILDIRAREKA